MRWQRVAARALAEVAGLTLSLHRPRHGLRILLYHAVGTRLSVDSYGISIAPERFERQMAILAGSKDLTTVGISDGLKDSPSLRVAVTFDDGYRDNLSVAAPILLTHGIPFTVFVTSSFVRSRSAGYLSPEDLRELAGLPGVTVGSHGATHRPLAECDEGALWSELRDSKRYLEDATGKPVTTLSYPHGSVSLRVMQAAKRAGYELGACSRFDLNADVDCNPLLLCRSEIVSADSERIFLQKIYGAWDWGRWRSRVPVAGHRETAEHPDSIYPLW
jgi:peptidoglycan/xylan/chitin deacetylase (PgdA/CDA1 family)